MSNDQHVAANLHGMDVLDFEGWNNADWHGVFAHHHTDDVLVDWKGQPPTHGIQEHIDAMRAYVDSAGGSVYSALSIVTMVRLRRLKVWVVVLGECSSAALLVFGVAKRRFVTPLSTLLFHRTRSESDKLIDATAARHWASHFVKLEEDLNAFQAHLFGGSEKLVMQWTEEGRFVTGKEVVEAGLAEMIVFE